MLLVDGHLDLAWNALQWNRDLRLPVHSLRTLEASTPGKGRAQNTVCLPDLQRGRTALCFATLLARSTGRPVPHVDFASSAQAYGVTTGQLAYYQALEKEGSIRIIIDLVGLERHLGEWQAWDDQPQPGPNTAPPLGLVLSMESADSVTSVSELSEWWERGLRLIGPAHYGPGRYAGGTGNETGLSECGFELLAEMQRLGFILDVTHLSDKAFWQALEQFSGTVIASHSNCRALVPHQRQLSDEQVQALIERNAVIGVALDAWMLEPGWVKGQSSNENTTLAQVADHIDHVCQVAGDFRHVAIGSDLDGGFGREQTPSDLDTVADLQDLTMHLFARGYTRKAVTAIMHGNWLDVLRQAWRKA